MIWNLKSAHIYQKVVDPWFSWCFSLRCSFEWCGPTGP